MNFKLIIKPVLTVILFSIALSAFASQRALCPAADMIKNEWKHLDTVQTKDSKFLVFSGLNPYFDKRSKLQWKILSIAITAPDFNKAFAIGQNNIRDIASAKQKYSSDKGGLMYRCWYLDNTGNTVGYAYAIINKQHGDKPN